MNLSENALNDHVKTPIFFHENKRNHFSHVAINDYGRGFQKWRLLFQLAYSEMSRRYRRTLLGPFWAVLSLAIFIGSMGGLFSLLWHTNVSTFLPYFASGYVVWTFFSTMITESCSTFIGSEHYLKQISFPYSFYAFLLITRNSLLFFHQITVYLVVAIIFHISWTTNTWLVIPGFILLIANCSWIAIALGLLCLRFRDIQPMVISLLQITMFVTPIFWSETQLGQGTFAASCINFNPFYHFLSVIRHPLLGQAPAMLSWIVDISILLVGWLLTMHGLKRVYNKLIYWL